MKCIFPQKQKFGLTEEMSGNDVFFNFLINLKYLMILSYIIIIVWLNKVIIVLNF